MKMPHASLDPERYKTRLRALRAVALFELTKGAFVLLLGFGLLSLVHKDTWDIAENILHFLHLSPRHRLAQVFLKLADNVTDAKLWAVAAGAAAYSTIRFIEGYGLWMARPWAEWLALVAGAIYLPFEIYQLVRRPNPVHGGVLIANLAIVLYMLFLRLSARLADKG